MAEGRLPIERTLILLDTNKFQGDEEAVELSFGMPRPPFHPFILSAPSV
jgi:hypothetical protein